MFGSADRCYKFTARFLDKIAAKICTTLKCDVTKYEFNIYRIAHFKTSILLKIEQYASTNKYVTRTFINRYADFSICRQLLTRRHYENELSKHGGSLVFESNLNPADLKYLHIKNLFLKDILYTWCYLNYDKNPQEINAQILWNNSHVRNQSKPFVF